MNKDIISNLPQNSINLPTNKYLTSNLSQHNNYDNSTNQSYNVPSINPSMNKDLTSNLYLLEYERKIIRNWSER